MNQNKKTMNKMVLRVFKIVVLFLKFFLPIFAITLLVNGLVFPSQAKVLQVLIVKSIITTLLSMLAIWVGVRYENARTAQPGQKRSKFRLFLVYYIPMIPYLELLMIAVMERDFSLFFKKLAVYLIAYAVLALYYMYPVFYHEFKRGLGVLKSTKSSKKRSPWIQVCFFFFMWSDTQSIVNDYLIGISSKICLILFSISSIPYAKLFLNVPFSLISVCNLSDRSCIPCTKRVISSGELISPLWSSLCNLAVYSLSWSRVLITISTNSVSNCWTMPPPYWLVDSFVISSAPTNASQVEAILSRRVLTFVVVLERVLSSFIGFN